MLSIATKINRLEDEARNEMVATLRAALLDDRVCPAECQSECPVQQLPVETNSDITVAEAAGSSHTKVLDESSAV